MLSNIIKYRIDLYWGGIRIAQITDFQNLQFGEKFNDFMDCSWTYIVNNIDPLLKKYLTAGLEVRVMRKSLQNDLDFKNVWLGRLREEPSYSADEKGQETLSFKVEHYGNYFFAGRFLTKTYTVTEETAIVRDAIDTIQSNTYYVGYTNTQTAMIQGFGSMEETGNIRDKECKKQDLKSVIQQLATTQNISALDTKKRGFRLLPDLGDSNYLIFNYFANYGRQSDVVFNNSLITKINRSPSGKIANLVTCEGKDITTQATTIDANNLDFFGILEEFVSFKDVSSLTDLQYLCNKELVKRQTPQVVYDVSLQPNNPYTGLFRAGDLIKIQFKNNWLNVNEWFRVYEINISFDGSGAENITIKIASDDPISLYNSREEKIIYGIIENKKSLKNLEKV